MILLEQLLCWGKIKEASCRGDPGPWDRVRFSVTDSRGLHVDQEGHEVVQTAGRDWGTSQLDNQLSSIRPVNTDGNCMNI